MTEWLAVALSVLALMFSILAFRVSGRRQLAEFRQEWIGELRKSVCELASLITSTRNEQTVGDTELTERAKFLGFYAASMLDDREDLDGKDLKEAMFALFREGGNSTANINKVFKEMKILTKNESAKIEAEFKRGF